MYRILIADDDYEDRELLKMEIQRSLSQLDDDLRFSEAVSVGEALGILKTRSFDLLTLDIEFDRMNEGIEALPGIFDEYPTLNIIVISGKLNKAEVTEQLFRFTRDNVLKGKRWARHFDVLDKKDDKAEALRLAYSFAFKQKEAADKVKDLFLLAESYLEKNEMNKCLEIYEKIQELAPGERESHENISIFQEGVSLEQAMEYYRKGEKLIASLILGHYLETRLRAYTRRVLGYTSPGLYDCLKDLERSNLIDRDSKNSFYQVLRFRNKAIHHPTAMSEHDIDIALKNLAALEAGQ